MMKLFTLIFMYGLLVFLFLLSGKTRWGFRVEISGKREKIHLVGKIPEPSFSNVTKKSERLGIKSRLLYSLRRNIAGVERKNRKRE
ncbi:hypothetical protein CEXT_238841 [Caerostris extrusa]|uniref:Uncharacterized protein n=1 Tax=Caerostris extrusa TaxID=172846 RepID=A0AAV4SMZ5_CAEEX|nr:hypothetical protein CEXT_238841 [Caerostris extrusa]